MPAGGGSFKATYVGDANYSGSVGSCEPVTGNKINSGTSTTIHAGLGANDSPGAPAITQAPIGSTVHDQATVTGSGPTPTGNVSFTWYTNTTCSGDGVTAGTVALAAGIAHPSSNETVPVGGGSFKASYGGDSTYNGSTGPCEPVEGTKINSSTATDIHAGPGANDGVGAPGITQAPIGSTVHDQAKVTGSGPTPTGTVDFRWYTSTSCTDNGIAAGSKSLDASGFAHPSSDEVVPVGGGAFKAHYNGDSVYNPSDGPCEPLTGTKLNSSTSTQIHGGAGAGDSPGAPGDRLGVRRLHRP